MNNKFLQFFYTNLLKTCVYFTVSIFITTPVAVFTEYKEYAPNLIFITLLFLFSFFLALINNIFKTKLNDVLKILLHFFGILISFILVFIIFPGKYKDNGFSIIIIIFFVFAYMIILALIIGIKGMINKRKNNKKDYKNQFGI